MMAFGEGVTQGFNPGTPDLQNNVDAWVWEKDATRPRRHGTHGLHPMPDPPAPGSKFSGTLVAGKLCVTINGAWAAGTKMSIMPRAHSASPDNGLDAYIPELEIINPAPDAIACATSICLAITNCYATAGKLILCSASTTDEGLSAKLTSELPGCPITWGCFNIVLT